VVAGQVSLSSVQVAQARCHDTRVHSCKCSSGVLCHVHLSQAVDHLAAITTACRCFGKGASDTLLPHC
jgi:hypothetical protein